MLLSVGVATLLGLLVPRLVRAATARGDARRRAAGFRGADEPGVLVTVTTRRWQPALLGTFGFVCALLGALATTASLAGGPGRGPVVGPVVTGIAMLLGGAGFVLLAHVLRRTRIRAMPDRLEVRQGLRAERTVLLSEIAEIVPLLGQYSGLAGRDAAGNRLFAVSGIARGYGEFSAYLRERVPLSPTDPGGAPGPGTLRP